jgi:hypothetical protein
VSRLRGLVGKLIDEVETADLINSAIFGGRGKLILGDPVRGEPTFWSIYPRVNSGSK